MGSHVSQVSRLRRTEGRMFEGVGLCGCLLKLKKQFSTSPQGRAQGDRGAAAVAAGRRVVRRDASRKIGAVVSRERQSQAPL